MTDQQPQPRPGDIDSQLEQLLNEAEATVDRLRKELEESRRQQAAREVDADVATADIAAQQAEVDRLQQHLADAQVHWSEVRAFFEAAIAELLSRHRRHESETGTDAGEGQP